MTLLQDVIVGRIAATVLLAAPLAVAQTTTTFRSSADDSEQPYALVVPKSYVPVRKYPLIISLHSEESNHRLNLRQVFGIPSRLGDAARDDIRFYAAKDTGYIVACPLARGTMGYRGVAETDVYDVLADVERRLYIDRDRVYLTGISMGGTAALRFALARPDIWAAVAAISPAAAPELAEFVPNATNLPIRLYHGDQDPIVPAEASRAWHRRLLDAGAPAEYIEFPGIRHNAWDFAYRGGALFEWFGKHRRNSQPERVRLVTQAYRSATAYWVTIDGLTPGVTASIDARRTGPSEIQVATSNVDGFTLSPYDEATQVTIDGMAVRVRADTPLSFEKVAGKWRPGRFQPSGKRPGLEGPISDALAGRHIYVYGTGGSPGPEELAARRAMAERAAVWSSNRMPRGLTFTVKADSAVTAADLDSADLVLFGTRDTNSVIAQHGSKLPMELNPGAADYGLLFIVPIGKHYALVSSGLPWWNGGEERGRGGDPFAPDSYRVLSTLGDFVLFKGSLAHVISEGRFTNEWKVPAEAASRMQAAGTVTIH